MVTYGQPRRLNALTVLLIAAALAGGYWLWRFFPAYFDAWSVDHLLKEAATSVYMADRLGEPQRTLELKNIVDKARALIVKQVGITDPELSVDLNISDAKATVTADYTVVVTHLLVSNTSIIHFHRERGADIKNVKW